MEFKYSLYLIFIVNYTNNKKKKSKKKNPNIMNPMKN